jgi:hypothetical protein
MKEHNFGECPKDLRTLYVQTREDALVTGFIEVHDPETGALVENEYGHALGGYRWEDLELRKAGDFALVEFEEYHKYVPKGATHSYAGPVSKGTGVVRLQHRPFICDLFGHFEDMAEHGVHLKLPPNANAEDSQKFARDVGLLLKESGSNKEFNGWYGCSDNS